MKTYIASLTKKYPNFFTYSRDKNMEEKKLRKNDKKYLTKDRVAKKLLKGRKELDQKKNLSKNSGAITYKQTLATP